MADGSTIEWLNRPGTKPASWNPIIAYRDVVMPDGTTKRLRGWHCEHVHEGCSGCYSEDMNETGRFMGTKLPYKPGHRKDVTIELHEPTLLQPLKWRQPRTIFVCSMTDLYGSWVKDEWLDKIKAVQALTPQHTYIELTKRPERMREYLSSENRCHVIGDRMPDFAAIPSGFKCVAWPFSNVWGLVSCSTQEDADKFVPIILDMPLAVRGVSAEPLLSGIDFTRVRAPHDPADPDAEWLFNALTTGDMYEQRFTNSFGETWYDSGDGPYREHALDFIIDGGESGAAARPYDLDASRLIEAHCQSQEVAYFRKQLGARPVEREPSAWPNGAPFGDGSVSLIGDGFGKYFVTGLKSKKGGDWNEWPEALRVRQFPIVIDGSVLSPAMASHDSDQTEDASA